MRKVLAAALAALVLTALLSAGSTSADGRKQCMDGERFVVKVLKGDLGCKNARHTLEQFRRHIYESNPPCYPGECSSESPRGWRCKLENTQLTEEAGRFAHCKREGDGAVAVLIFLGESSSGGRAVPRQPPSSVSASASEKAGDQVYATKDCTKPRIEPSRIVFTCADFGLYYTVDKWSYFNEREAGGIGKMHANDCTPDCADGTFHKFKARIRLYQPRRQSCAGRKLLIFQKAEVRFLSSKPKGLHRTEKFGTACADY